MSARRTHRLRLEVLKTRITPSLTPVGNEFRVNVPTYDFQRYDSITATPDGNFLVVFHGWDNTLFGSMGGVFGITAQRYRPDGTMIGSRIAVGLAGSLTDGTAVATDPAGNFVVTWTSYSEPNQPAAFAIMGRQFNAAGLPLGPEFQVNQVDMGVSYPDVVFTTAGQFVATWVRNIGSNTADIMSRHFAADGTPMTDDILVAHTGGAWHPSRLTATHDNGYVVTWFQPSPAMEKFQRFDSNDQPITAAIGVGNIGLYPAILPNDSSNDVLIVSNAGYQRYSPSGVAIGSNIPFQGTMFSQVALSPQNEFIFFGRAASTNAMLADSFHSDGTIAVSQFQVNTSPTTSYLRYEPTVAVNQNGDAMFVWDSDYQDGDYWGVYARNYIGDPAQPAAPPAINGGTASRSSVNKVGLAFSRQVALPTNPAAAFELKNTLGNVIPVSVDTAASNHFTLAFPTYPAGLPDGRYTLKMLAAQVHDAAGRMLDGNGDGTPGDDLVMQFHKLTGDFNGDAKVDQADFMSFRTAIGGTNSMFDLDGDGVVDMNDFMRFRSSFGLSV